MSFQVIQTKQSDRVNLSFSLQENSPKLIIEGVKKYGKIGGWILSKFGYASKTPTGEYVTSPSAKAEGF